MGVSGCGKTTIGRKLSEALGMPFFDADDFHPKANISKMASGLALNDNDRLPWLQQLAKNIDNWESKEGAVLACSALKESYREILMSKKEDIIWIVLSGSKALVKDRIQKREGHFMSSDLLDSQYKDLEIPKYGIHVDIAEPPREIIKRILSKF